MSLISRVLNVFRGDRVNREIDEELEAHLEEALANGREPGEARRALGNALQLREQSRDVRAAAMLGSVLADVRFAARQLTRNKVTAGAAVLSLALAIGACTSAFRLIDALLLRPLPVANPERLHVIEYSMTDNTGKVSQGDSFEYPLFRTLRAAAKGEAELLAISYPRRSEITWTEEPERVNLQFVSGWTFGTFGLTPVLGRQLTESDDQKPGAHAVAVLSYDYWKSRFGSDPGVIGRSFRHGNDLYQVVGVAPAAFAGTEAGTLTDLFVPTMMNARAIENPGWSWFRIWVQLAPGTSATYARDKLQAAFRHYRSANSGDFAPHMSKKRLEEFVNTPLSLEPAAAGFSGLQKNYRRSLYILGGMVALLLLIACANVANLMLAQGTARAREMALRISIGAGRSRLIQLMLVESALIAALASLAGGLFAWWAAPFVVSLISSPDNPTRLVLSADWRVMSFAVALAVAVTLLFGLIPALRASGVKPASALKGGEETGSRHRLMHTLAAAQVTFCFVVYFVAGLFVASFERISSQPTGFSSDNLLVLETVAKREQPPEFWNQVTAHLGSMQGVESASLSAWPLMGHSMWRSDVWIDGRQVQSGNPWLLTVSPEFLGTMRIPLLGGRQFRPEDKSPSVAIVTESFARQYLGGENPVGRQFERLVNKTERIATTIVGYVRDVRYAGTRDPISPVIFLPVNRESDKGGPSPKEWGTFIVRTEGGPLHLVETLRHEVSRIRPEFRVTNITTQKQIVESHTVRERLLAMLSVFFAAVSLVLAGVGLYGLLNYSVLQRQREIGIRVALGARAAQVVRPVTAQIAAVLVAGSVAGLALGMASVRYIESLLYQVTARDISAIAIPVVMIVSVALLAAIPPVMRAVRTDPALVLRAD